MLRYICNVIFGWHRRLVLGMVQFVPIFFLLLLAAGCARPRSVVTEMKSMEPVLVWPLPPENPRIQYIRSIATPEDLGITKSFFSKVFEFFFGKSEERVRQPYGVASDSEGRVYIADSGLRIVHVFDLPGGKYWSIRGTSQEEFQFPVGVALDKEGRLYVSDAERGVVIGFDRGGSAFLRISEGLQRPAGLAFNLKNGLLYVTDVLRHEILAYDPKGKLRFSFGGRGSENRRFNFPTNIAVDREGMLYVTDSMNFRVQIFRPDGTFLARFGRLGDALGDLSRPKGIGVDSEGHIYLVEGLYDVVNVFDREGRLLLTFGNPGKGRGEFWLATGLFIDGRDRIYVADSFNSRVQVFQYLPNAR
ncbi:MAG: 6-bladed beta-propeller [Candidatus Binatia bacterium]